MGLMVSGLIWVVSVQDILKFIYQQVSLYIETGSCFRGTVLDFIEKLMTKVNESWA